MECSTYGGPKKIVKIMQGFREMKDFQCLVDRMSTNRIKGFFPCLMKFEIPQKEHEAYDLWHVQCIGLEQFCSAPKLSRGNPLCLYWAGRHTKETWRAG